MLNPERTLAIVCGAKEWPQLDHYEAAAAFANSANLIRRYLAGKKGLGLPRDHILWLFGKPNAVAQYQSITQFLQRQFAALSAPRGKGVLILFFYIGHGAFFPPSSSRTYCLLVRDTLKLFEEQTSLQVALLARLFRLRAADSQRILFLDCCFAGEAARLFQGELDQVVSAKANEVVEEDPADRGVALLCASSARNPAKVESLTSYTYFGHELIQVLTKGDPDISGPLTLRRMCQLVRRGLRSAAGDDPPNPEVHVPDQERGDLAAVPLFPNPAWHGPITPRRDHGKVSRKASKPEVAVAPASTASNSKTAAHKGTEQASGSLAALSSTEGKVSKRKLPKQASTIPASKGSQELGTVPTPQSIAGESGSAGVDPDEARADLFECLAELDETTSRLSYLPQHLSNFEWAVEKAQRALRGFLPAMASRSGRADLGPVADDFMAAADSVLIWAQTRSDPYDEKDLAGLRDLWQNFRASHRKLSAVVGFQGSK